MKKNLKKYIPRIFFIIIGIILAGCTIRVALWEKQYYAEKEGSERAVAVSGDVETIGDGNETSEEEITEQQRVEYTVAPEKPRYIYVDKLGISKARVLEVGVNAKGQMQTPKSIHDAAWYNGSDLPGTGGTAVFDGHNGAGSKGIFKELNKLKVGDLIKIEMGDGKVYTYRVHENVEIKLSEADKHMAEMMRSPVDGQESITIISCSGEYSLQQKTYLSRQFVRATRVE